MSEGVTAVSDVRYFREFVFTGTGNICLKFSQGIFDEFSSVTRVLLNISGVDIIG
jgi:hypothetical protein